MEIPGIKFNPNPEEPKLGEVEISVGGTGKIKLDREERIQALEKRLSRLYKFLGLGE